MRRDRSASVHRLPPSVLEVAFADARRGMARMSDWTTILQTVDGGATWYPLQFDERARAAFLSEENIWGLACHVDGCSFDAGRDYVRIEGWGTHATSDRVVHFPGWEPAQRHWPDEFSADGGTERRPREPFLGFARGTAHHQILLTAPDADLLVTVDPATRLPIDARWSGRDAQGTFDHRVSLRSVRTQLRSENALPGRFAGWDGPGDYRPRTRIGRSSARFCVELTRHAQWFCFEANADGRVALRREDDLPSLTLEHHGATLVDDASGERLNQDRDGWVTFRALDPAGRETAARAFPFPRFDPSAPGSPLYGAAWMGDAPGFVRVTHGGDRLTFLPLDGQQPSSTIALRPVYDPPACTRLPDARTPRFRARYLRHDVPTIDYYTPSLGPERIFTVEDGRLCRLEDVPMQHSLERRSSTDRYDRFFARSGVLYTVSRLFPDGRYCREVTRSDAIERYCATRRAH